VQLRVQALLVDKGLVDPDALDALIDTCESEMGPRNGARMVARAWVDPDLERRLLANGSQAPVERGFQGRPTDSLVVVENTPSVHCLVACTPWSCHPWPTRPPPGAVIEWEARGFVLNDRLALSPRC
jgi:nitrile hydratase subunit alpha